jgi:hypothetical protein
MKMPFLDAKGMAIGTYGITHDITEPLTNMPNRHLLRDRWEHVVNDP